MLYPSTMHRSFQRVDFDVEMGKLRLRVVASRWDGRKGRQWRESIHLLAPNLWEIPPSRREWRIRLNIDSL